MYKKLTNMLVEAQSKGHLSCQKILTGCFLPFKIVSNTGKGESELGQTVTLIGKLVYQLCVDEGNGTP